MINLIPPDAEKTVKREYLVRISSVWLYLFAAACVIVAVLYIPTYLLLSSQLKAYEGEFASVSIQAGEFKEAETALKNTNVIIDFLAKEERTPLFSTVLETIEGITPEAITLDGYTLSRKNGALGALTVSGEAKNRASLAQFRSALEAHKLFKTATLPLSNLTKDKDIPFAISIIPEDGEGI
jgi:hypothetical protein